MEMQSVICDVFTHFTNALGMFSLLSIVGSEPEYHIQKISLQCRAPASYPIIRHTPIDYFLN